MFYENEKYIGNGKELSLALASVEETSLYGKCKRKSV
jgi:hypothetical protein